MFRFLPTGYRYLRSLIKFISGQPELTGVCIYLRSKLLDRFKWITYMGVNLPNKYPLIVMVLHLWNLLQLREGVYTKPIGCRERLLYNVSLFFY